MGKLYNVSIINKHDVWLQEDEENPFSWVVMSKEQLEQILYRPLKRGEMLKGREIADYDDIVWINFL
ncbi:MAG: hypothetical protein HQ591_10745 [candidate division Zixibacteria bacterium]|nr:hypothetical protein [Candidatus Tariuqbacter arcticus]